MFVVIIARHLSELSLIPVADLVGGGGLHRQIFIEIICNLNYSCSWGWDPAFIIKSPHRMP